MIFLLCRKQITFKTLIMVCLMVLTGFSLGSCKINSNSKEEILTPEQMVNVATDIHLVEAGIKYIRRTQPVDDGMVYAAYDSIFKKNNTSKQQYEVSMKYYEENPQKLDKIYTEVITRLTKMQPVKEQNKAGK